METKGIKLLLLLAILHTSYAFSDLYYKAGIFEIKQFNEPGASGEEIIQKNLEKYNIAGDVAKKNKVDIMVYPEEGMLPDIADNETWYIYYAEDIPDPRLEIANPCNEPLKFKNSPILRNLSCLAKTNNFYVVADQIDVKSCEVRPLCNDYNQDYCRTNKQDCPESGKFHFNTLVAFNRQGFLVVRYHKRHLFFETGIDYPRDSSNKYLETEFGIFEAFVCFDSFFVEVVQGAKKPGVTGVVFPTWWYDFTPFFYFASAYQQAWSLTNGVNFIGANVHDPRIGSLGSGIYIPAIGQIVYTHNPDGLSKILISKVPISNKSIPPGMTFDTKFYYMADNNTVTELNGEEPRNFKRQCGDNVLGDPSDDITDYRCHQTEVSQYTFVKLNDTRGNISVCSNGFCCSMNYTADSMNENFYFGVSGNPLNFLDTFLIGVESCFLARCDPLNGEPCTDYILKSNTIFRSVEIQGSFTAKTIYPFAINSDIRLTDKKEWNFDQKSRLTYKNLKGNPLLFLCLYGRLYQNDQTISSQME